MPWFHRRPEPEPSEALATLARRVDDLEKRAGDQESSTRRLRVEWADTVDRLTRLAGRISKRAERAADASADDQADGITPSPASASAAEALRIVQLRRRRG